MEEFIIKDIEKDVLTLENCSDMQIIKHEFVFFDVKPKIGDRLLFHKELLDPQYEEYSICYYFGNKDEIFGRKLDSLENRDALVLLSGKKEILLKRFYG